MFNLHHGNLFRYCIEQVFVDKEYFVE